MKTFIDFLQELDCPQLDNNTFWIGNDNGYAFIEIYQDGNTLKLEKIWVPTQDRKKGYGSLVMNILTHYADEMGFDIILEADEIVSRGLVMNYTDRIRQGATNKKNRINPKRLPKWYSKFGFDFVEKVDGKWKMKYSSKSLAPSL